jgi:hypothetical protein
MQNVQSLAKDVRNHEDELSFRILEILLKDFDDLE